MYTIVLSYLISYIVSNCIVFYFIVLYCIVNHIISYLISYLLISYQDARGLINEQCNKGPGRLLHQVVSFAIAGAPGGLDPRGPKASGGIQSPNVSECIIYYYRYYICGSDMI